MLFFSCGCRFPADLIFPLGKVTIVLFYNAFHFLESMNKNLYIRITVLFECIRYFFMNLKVSFLWIGLVIFALPMLINIAYVMSPPAGKAEQPAAVAHWIDIVEQISRIVYLFAVTLLLGRDELGFWSGWLYLAAVFLILYYAVWFRYFMGGREIYLLSCSFFFVPMPLAA